MASVTLRISVSDPDATISAFDAIQVLRSRTTADGPYELTTANVPAAAKLLAPDPGLYTVVGKTLGLLIDDDAQLDVVFTGTDPLTAAQVAAQINTAAGKTIAADAAGFLELTSTNPGSGSVVEIAAGSAASAFGWVAGDRASGKDAHITLEADRTLYEYVDNDGGSNFFYKTQFVNTTTGQVSTESEPFLGGPGTILPASDLSIAKIDLVDAKGIAVPDQEITFYSVHEPLTVSGFTVALQRAPVTAVTNNQGHAEIPLVRGLKVRAVFEGTSVIREFTVPDVDEFDLLSVLGSAPDPFKIVEIQFPAAPRRTL